MHHPDLEVPYAIIVMQLNYRQYSTQGKALIILHGLFGSLSNWGWHSKQLAQTFAVYGLDLRNHGDSPHADALNYRVMANDVCEFMHSAAIEECAFIGHSMGGKVAMQLALSHPELLTRLMVVDIAPVAYLPAADSQMDVLAGMEAMEVEALSSRKEAEQRLAATIEDEATRKFVLTNLIRNADGGYRWRLNLASIRDNYDRLQEKPLLGEAFTKPTLFVKGALSNYIQAQNEEEILDLFPRASVKTIMQAGHWLHAERPQAFQKIATDFLLQDEN
ncbi:MAG: alpha/beta fold hydrolase [Proteobacteria bacterium]|nr:alpha/beta fold hydrolase [Pseudomonadota bacterium]MCH8175058.1 alpha/beta fold hydrolase [Pseudomonadota bacterium]